MATENDAPIMIGLGEVLWDCFGETRRPGGAPANVAFHARQLGLDAHIFSRVGKDELGAELLDFLTQQGVPVDSIQQDSGHPTGTVTVHMDAADSPSYTIHEDVAWDYMKFTPDWRATCEKAAAVCFGTLAQRHSVSRETIARCLAAAGNALRIYDVNLRPPHFERRMIEISLQAASVAKMNGGECDKLSKLLETGGDNTLDQAESIRAIFNLSLVCITRGEEGCLLVGREGTVDQPGEPVQVADAVGAGDAFTAALTYGLLNDWPLDRVAPFANRVGGLVASSSGAMPSLGDQLNQLKATATG
jgi:fructokinase